jgi:lipopolysaccharide/colanic/teichoic acid biosynthesis glycosyltransferase
VEKDSQQYGELKLTVINRYRIGKRIFDILTSTFLIICLFPIYLIVSVIIATSSGRPILYLQERAGKDNEIFTIYKFRSMNSSIHKPSKRVYDWKNGVPDNFIFKSGFDVTITPFGRFLRKYSLDELPQLFNVLLGDMSMVGPRPEIIEISEHYNAQQAKRLQVKPGMTGYAQVNGRSEINHGKKIEYDLYYIENQSFLLDMKIILTTIKCVIKGKGAF